MKASTSFMLGLAAGASLLAIPLGIARLSQANQPCSTREYGALTTVGFSAAIALGGAGSAKSTSTVLEHETNNIADEWSCGVIITFKVQPGVPTDQQINSFGAGGTQVGDDPDHAVVAASRIDDKHLRIEVRR